MQDAPNVEGLGQGFQNQLRQGASRLDLEDPLQNLEENSLDDDGPAENHELSSALLNTSLRRGPEDALLNGDELVIEDDLANQDGALDGGHNEEDGERVRQ